MARPNVLVLSVLLIATMSVVALAERCAYTIKVQTGPQENAGTDSIIGALLADKSGELIEIKDLVTWGGKMPPGHKYFGTGQLDVFSGTEKCLPNPVCFLTLNSDYSGVGQPGWYVNNLDVLIPKSGKPIEQVHFELNQWLSLDVPPYVISTTRDNCPRKIGFEIRKNLNSII